jgi:hypothetical protein
LCRVKVTSRPRAGRCVPHAWPGITGGWRAPKGRSGGLGAPRGKRPKYWWAEMLREHGQEYLCDRSSR